jgi:hypothetical protein
MKKKTKKAKSKVKAKAKPKAKKAKKVVRAKVKTTKTKKAAPKAKKSKKTSAKPKMSVIPPPNSKLLGRVEDFYAHIGVIAFTLRDSVRVGDSIQVLGHTTNLQQPVTSMQIDHQPVTDAKAKDAIGIKITGRSRRGDYVFLLLR